MYGYVFAAAEVGVTHRIRRDIMLYPGYEPHLGRPPSIMHYGASFFSKNGSPTLIRRSNPADTNFGHRQAATPSPGDIRAINEAYGPFPATPYVILRPLSSTEIQVFWPEVAKATSYRISVRERGYGGSFTISRHTTTKGQNSLFLEAKPGTPYIASVNTVAPNGNLSAAVLSRHVTTPR